MMENDPFASEQLIELEAIEDEERERAVKGALAKFGFFLHITAWISGEAFLLILGILVPKSLPYILIPVVLWTLGLAYHGYRSFVPRSRQAAVASKLKRLNP